MATIFGTFGNDSPISTSKADAIYGFAGNDTLTGGDGADSLFGGEGNDILRGSELRRNHMFSGPDYLDGGPGFDRVVHYESLLRGIRADLRTGTVTFVDNSEVGVERLVGIEAIQGAGAWDRMIGNGAANLLIGDAGNDTLFGNYGADTLLGGTGSDLLVGGNGADSIDAGAGRDTVLGGNGNDIIGAGTGADRLYGGSGNDTVVVGGTYNTIANLVGNGHLQLNDGPQSTLISIESLGTNSGDDTVLGSGRDNILNVGDGKNVVYGLGGNDTIIGGLYGEDTLNGGAGDDVISGGGSYVDGQVGTDVLRGGEGNDTLVSLVSNLILSGGAGDDVFAVIDTAGRGSREAYPTAEITDFEAGDVIRFDFDFGTAEFVGQVTDASELGRYEAGYMRSGDRTLVFVNLPDVGTDLDQQFLEITLTGFRDALTATNFDLG